MVVPTTKAEYLAVVTGAIVDHYVHLVGIPGGSIPDFFLNHPDLPWEMYGTPVIAGYSEWPDELAGMTLQRGWRHRCRFPDGDLIFDTLELDNPGERGTYYVYVLDNRVVFIERPWVIQHMAPPLPPGE
jgi:hypothetical protein